MNKSSQNGSAIIWILIAVALFAALTYAFNSSSRTSISFLSDAQAEAYADEILDIMETSRRAVQKMEILGCDLKETSFLGAEGGFNYAPIVATPQPPDRCFLFNGNGGGLRYNKPDARALNSGFSGASGYGETIYIRNKNIVGAELDGTGSNYAHHVIIPYVSDQVCLTINNKVNNQEILPHDTDGVGTILPARPGRDPTSSGVTLTCEANNYGASNECGTKTGCFKLNSLAGETDVNIAYRILARDPP